MAKSANPGEMRTAVYFKQIERVTDADGFPVEQEINIFGQDADGKDITVRGKWVNAHGAALIAAMQLQLREPVTFTTRYSPLYHRRLLVYKAGDPLPYEIIGLDNVEDRGRWVEMKLQRKEAAR